MMKSSFQFTIFLILFIFNSCGVCKKIPDYVPVCGRNDPEIANCIEDAIEELRPRLKVGMPDFGVTSLDPFIIPSFVMQRGPRNANIQAEVSDIVSYGVSDFNITDLRADLKNHMFRLTLYVPKVAFKAKYNMNIRISLINIRGKGNLNGTLYGYELVLKLKGKLVTRDDVEYMEATGAKISFNYTDTKLYMSDLFSGSPFLNELSNQIINENSKAFFDEIKPVIESTMTDYFINATRDFVREIPYDELFPENVPTKIKE